MLIKADTLDDALRTLYPPLLGSDLMVETSRGPTRELIGVQVQIAKPLARLSRTETRGRPFSSLGEFLWYMSRRNDLEFIEYYVPKYRRETEDGATVFGGYGPRLFDQRGEDQIRNVIAALRKSDTTRRAVVQLFNAEDIAARKKRDTVHDNTAVSSTIW